MTGITLLGLGPGDPALLTRRAWDVLSDAQEIWLRTDRHPAVSGFPASLAVHSFDHLYDNGESFDAVYEQIVDQVVELGKRSQGVIYAVPGDPFVAEATTTELAGRAHALNIPLFVVSGISFLEPTFAALGLDPYPRLVLSDAMALSQAHVPPFPPDTPVLVAQIYSRLIAAEVKMTLACIYPEKHPVRLVHAAGTPDQVVEDLPLYKIDRSRKMGMLTSLFIPPLREGASFESFQEVVARLRAPDGCPWDREQTHQSLRMHLLEEAYEVLAAIDSGKARKMAEEFGDLLLQIVLQAQIASEAGDFTMAEVIQQIYDKIIRRHPHVFGDFKVDGVRGVLQNWEKLKDAERRSERESENGLLDGVPLALPALSQAWEYQDRAARVGFDWPEIGGVLEKISEEIQEVQRAADGEQLAAEIGDLFFALVNLARWKKVDAESALRETNLRFKRRLAYVEHGLRKKGKKFSEASLEEMEALWQESKK